MKGLVRFTSYDFRTEVEKIVDIPKGNINNLSFSYDGGRVSLYINNQEIFSSKCAGNDCNIEVE
jgi:hypothetical protein